MTKILQEKLPEPYHTLSRWIDHAILNSNYAFPAACVLSTIGLNGFPNARNVSLKEFRYPYLIITSSLNSVKAKEINQNSHVALTFWWESLRRQIRIQGVASEIDDKDADRYFSERNKSSQAVSSISEQSKPIAQFEVLKETYETFLTANQERTIPRPNHWKGFKIEPIQMEFLEFEDSRFHRRVLYLQEKGNWIKSEIQP